MRRAVAATRQAISPRLAIRIFLNMMSLLRIFSSGAGTHAGSDRPRRSRAMRPSNAQELAPARPISHDASTSTSASAARRRTTTGCATASHSMTGTEAVLDQRHARHCENGSGEVLIAARVVGLGRMARGREAAAQQRRDPAPCLAWSAPNTPAASAAPAGMRITRVDHVPDRVDQRNLVGEELDEAHEAAGAPARPGAAAPAGPAAGRPSPGSRPGRSAAPPRTGACRSPSRARRPAPAAAAVSRSCIAASMAFSSASQDGLRLLQEGLHALRALRRWRGCRRCPATVSVDQRVVDRRGPPRPAPAPCRPAPRPGRRRTSACDDLGHLGIELVGRAPLRARSRCACASAASKRSAVRK